MTESKVRICLLESEGGFQLSPIGRAVVSELCRDWLTRRTGTGDDGVPLRLAEREIERLKQANEKCRAVTAAALAHEALFSERLEVFREALEEIAYRPWWKRALSVFSGNSTLAALPASHVIAGEAIGREARL